jgi:hypothetical protein
VSHTATGVGGALASVTVIAEAAVAGNTETFMAWRAFAEGRAAGFTFMALATAAIAVKEARTAQRATPLRAS